jgi:hypothetical protein
MLAAAAAPAFVQASSLMPVWVPPAPKVWTPFDDMDFEEGSFTPSVMGLAGRNAVGTGSYTRIGQTVHFRTMVKMSSPARHLELIGIPGAQLHTVKDGNQIMVVGTLRAKHDGELDAALPRFLARRKYAA